MDDKWVAKPCEAVIVDDLNTFCSNDVEQLKLNFSTASCLFLCQYGTRVARAL